LGNKEENMEMKTEDLKISVEDKVVANYYHCG